MRFSFLASGILAVLLQPFALSAQPGLSWVAFVDASYAYDFNKPYFDRHFFTQPARHNRPEVALAVARARYQAVDTRAALALTYSTYREEEYSAQPSPYGDVLEASGGIRLRSDALWLDVGILPSHIGIESPISALNWTATRSMTAEFAPYYETGARITFERSPRFNASLVYVNGWQTIDETNLGKAGGIRVQLRPADRVVLTYSNYVGDEAPSIETVKMMRIFHDFSVQLGLGRLSVAATYDRGAQWTGQPDHLETRRDGDVVGIGHESYVWKGAALLANLRVTDELSVVGRREYFRDPHELVVQTGVGVPFAANGRSIGIDYRPVPFTVLKVEGRATTLSEPLIGGRDDPELTREWVLISSLSIWLR